MELLLKGRPRTRLALEFIEFQNDTIGADLEQQFTSVIEKIKKGEYADDIRLADCDELNKIKAMTLKRFGLKIDIITDVYTAAVLPFYPNVHHVFMKDWFRGEPIDRSQQKLLAKSNVQKGTVNTEKAVVSGIFSEYEVPLHLNIHKLVREEDVTPAELTAIYFHELGHAFYACEYSDRLETTNQVIADVFRELTGRKDKKDVAYVYRELKKINKDVLESEVEQLFGENRVIAGYTWFKVCIGTIQSQLSDNTYDRTAFEAAADNFVNRFGYGRAAVTGLQKAHANDLLGSNTPAQVTISLMLSSLTFVAYIAGMAAAVFTGAIVPALFIGYVFGLVLRVSGDDIRDMTYDDLKTRYQRMRNDMIEYLKRGKIKTDKAADMIEAIKAVDEIIHATAEQKSMFTMVCNALFPSARDANKSVAEQKLLEKLMFNDLFLKSAELKVAAS